MNSSLENFTHLVAAVAQRSEYSPESIACNLMKIYKLSRSLGNRNGNTRNYAWAQCGAYLDRTKQLEARAVALGAELGLEVKCNRGEGMFPVSVNVGSKEWGVS